MRTSMRIIIVGMGVFVGAASVPAGDACRATARAAHNSCLSAARADYALALGKSANIADSDARRDSEQEARATLREAVSECRDQLEARLAACARLGSAPYDPVIDPSNFGGPIDNPYYPLVPGTIFTYVGTGGGVVESNVVAVTRATKVILGVTCVEVQDSVFVDGELTEETLDWFAQDKDGNVWYFGENTHELDGNEITNIDGSFKAGVNGAKAGIIMKAHPAVGDFYRQEFDLGNAEDLAEVISLNETITVPLGGFINCRETEETTPLEPDARERKFYAPGVGPILTQDLVGGTSLPLVQVTTY